MEAIGYEVTPLLGVRKIRIRLNTEKRGSVDLELTLSDMFEMQKNITDAMMAAHKEEQYLLATVDHARKMAEEQLYGKK